MTPHKRKQDQESENRGSIYPPMKRALVLSIIVHVIVVILIIVGVPYIHKKRDLPETISVELATIADITQTNKPPVEAPKPPEPPKEEVRPEPARPTPAPSPTPPKAEPKPEPPKEKPEEVKKEPPPPDDLAPPKKEEKEKQKKEPPKQDQTKELNTLLKNLIKEEPKPKTNITDLTKKLTATATPSPAAAVGPEMTMSDMDALRQQLAGCWNIFAGAAEAEDLAVDIHVIVNSDRTVQSASILDQSRYNSDDRFRAAADSALRAVQNPKCSPLNLPPEKYNVWHDMIINFDPKEML